MGQLELALNQELARLGKDPARQAAAAPTGARNSVFFLSLFLQDPDGGGPTPPVGVEVLFCEQCIGDYDANGEVNIGDLTPLGLHFNELIDYDPPAMHGGFDAWPAGVPEDDSGAGPGNPAPTTSPAYNWRMARVDGDCNGELNISDVTPIAQHWGERTDGYRVYRKRPGETQFTMLHHPDPGVADITAFRPPADATRPVLLVHFDELQGATSGVFEYYVAPYDQTNGEEGVESVHVSVNIATGAVSLSPIAAIAANPTSGAPPLAVNFDASASADPDGTITKFEWDPVGSGTFTVDTGTTPTTQYTYNTYGSYNAAVRVTDNSGSAATAFATISVSSGGPNQAPTAAFTHFPTSGPASLQVFYDASTSSDSDGYIVNYGWDWETDGTIDLNTASSNAAHIFTAVNQWKTTLTVTDDKGATDSAFVLTDVTGSGGPNNPPTAVINATPTTGNHPLTVNFDASGSTDSDGTIAQYQWNFDGDFSFDEFGTQPTTSHVYYQPGSYSASVRVFDDDGAHSTAYTTISVSPGGPYWHIYDVDVLSARNNIGQCDLDVVDNRPAITYADQATQKVYYVRASDSQGTAWPAPVAVAPAGIWGGAVSLEVINGRPAIAYSKSNNILPDELYFSRATDSTGGGWGAPLQVSPKIATTWTVTLGVVNGNPVIMYPSEHGTGYVRATDLNGGAWAAPVYPYAVGGYYADLEIIEGQPAICHVDSVPRLIYQRSSDINGSTWVDAQNTPQLVLEPSAVDYPSMIIAAGNPAVCFYYYGQSNFSLRYRHATDKYGNQWDPAQVLDSGSYTIGLHCDMDTTFGVPYICYAEYQPTPNLKAITAQDGQGSVWSPPEIVTNTNVEGTSVHTVSNWPAVAFIDGYGLHFGIKYQ